MSPCSTIPVKNVFFELRLINIYIQNTYVVLFNKLKYKQLGTTINAVGCRNSPTKITYQATCRISFLSLVFVVLCLSAVVNKKAVGVGERAQRQGGGAANDDAIKHNMSSTHRT